MFANGGRSHFSMPLIALFLIFCALSVIVNQPPSYFRAWGRLAGFAMVVLIMSPMITSIKMSLLRHNLLFIILWICAILSVGSFFCYFLGINFFIMNEEVLAIRVGSFAGLFKHSMVLGPIAGLSSIFLYTLYLDEKKLWALFLAICCVGSTFLSASRAAVAGCLVGIIVSYIRFYRGQISKGVFVGLFISIVLVASFPLWGGVTDFVMAKQAGNVAAGGTFSSRESIWDARIAEIKENPIFGIGFSCVDERYSYVDKSKGTIEPGSSWLAIFSMTGFFGFLTFLLVFCLAMRSAWSIPSKKSYFLSGCLSFYAVHLIFEGYLLAVGNFIGMLFWLFLGQVWDSIPTNSWHRKM